MMTTLLLLRHAQTASNVNGRYMGNTNEDLSQEGVRQASRLADRLSSWPIAGIWSSPLLRAVRTAEAVANSRGLTVEQDNDLTEIDIGDWQGMFGTEIALRYPDLWKAWRTEPASFQAPNGESLVQVQRRVVAALDRIAAVTPDHMAALVTHDAVIRLLVANCLEVSVSVYRRLEIANASLTVVLNTRGRWRLRLLNDTGHLGDEPYKD